MLLKSNFEQDDLEKDVERLKACFKNKDTVINHPSYM